MASPPLVVFSPPRPWKTLSCGEGRQLFQIYALRIKCTTGIDASDQLATMAPTPTIAGFKPLLHTDAQRTSQPEIDAFIQYQYLNLGPLCPLAQVDIAADRNPSSGLVFPLMDPLATQTFNEGREVEVVHSGSSYS